MRVDRRGEDLNVMWMTQLQLNNSNYIILDGKYFIFIISLVICLPNEKCDLSKTLFSKFKWKHFPKSMHAIPTYIICKLLSIIIITYAWWRLDYLRDKIFRNKLKTLIPWCDCKLLKWRRRKNRKTTSFTIHIAKKILNSFHNI